MQIHIAVKHSSCELDLETSASQDEILEALTRADRDGEPLVLTDDKGRKVFVPAGGIASVELGEASQRRVGFGI